MTLNTIFISVVTYYYVRRTSPCRGAQSRRHWEQEGTYENPCEHDGNAMGTPRQSRETPDRLRNERLAQTHESSNFTKAVDACACEEINRFQSNRTRDQPRIQRRFVARLPPHLCMLSPVVLVLQGLGTGDFVFPLPFGVAAFGGAASKRRKTGEVSFFRRLRVLNFR